jgi:hypothetical protein
VKTMNSKFELRLLYQFTSCLILAIGNGAIRVAFEVSSRAARAFPMHASQLRDGHCRELACKDAHESDGIERIHIKL